MLYADHMAKTVLHRTQLDHYRRELTCRNVVVMDASRLHRIE
jgi:hypothetical protein